MRAHPALLVAILIGLFVSPGSAAEPEWPPLDWKKLAASPFPRAEAATTAVDGKLYLFGGFVSNLDASGQVDIYDPLRDTWSRGKEMPTRPTHANPAVDGRTVWLAGGFLGKHPGPATNEVWKYDMDADEWSRGPPLPEPRAGGGLAISQGRLHFFGGYTSDRDTVAADHWSLPLRGNGSWTREADMPNPRGHLAAATLDGSIYALGGANGHDRKQVDQAFCERYDPSTKRWTPIASLPEGRSHFESSTIVHEGRIIIVAGRCNAAMPPRMNVDDILAYDPKADSWRLLATVPLRLMSPSVQIVGRQLVVVGGGVGKPLPLTADVFVAPLPNR